jgi:hypothetical protein
MRAMSTGWWWFWSEVGPGYIWCDEGGWRYNCPYGRIWEEFGGWKYTKKGPCWVFFWDGEATNTNPNVDGSCIDFHVEASGEIPSKEKDEATNTNPNVEGGCIVFNVDGGGVESSHVNAKMKATEDPYGGEVGASEKAVKDNKRKIEVCFSEPAWPRPWRERCNCCTS